MMQHFIFSPSANETAQLYPDTARCPFTLSGRRVHLSSMNNAKSGSGTSICRRQIQKRLLMFLICLFGQMSAALAQTTSDFETISLGGNLYLADAGPGGVFQEGNVALVNSFDPTFQSWEGWALSRVTDNVTPGFTNQFSSIVGAGEGGSQTYAVSYAFSPSIIRLTGAAKGGIVKGMYVTNSTYAYYSMVNGDAFAKKFGGVTGTDPDFFLLTVKGWLNGQVKPDSVDFYLADYRSAQSSNDYIVKSWTYLNLASLGPVDSLSFSLTSSDVGAFGMNTPAYFCMDKITTQDNSVATLEPENLSSLAIYPNPARHEIFVSNNKPGPVEYALFDALGKQVLGGELIQNRLDISQLEPGVYVISLNGQASRFIKI